ncbi:MAG: HIT family protein [Thermoflexus sp.]|uniref:HIT family protein n=1 Tax=Thermoflexus sp. TaxID=1969742 RepID=UPI0025E64FE0|nr:HIT family protein [Thermoflexus sp.]MCS6962835.1 HIT family protein [Thermoflexus sp.]
MNGCVFCAIVARQQPAEIVYEDEQTMAFMDIHPANPGHTLVIPKRHAATIFDIDEEDAAAVMRTAVRVARAIQKALTPDGLNLVQSNGRAGGQEIFHLHVHVIPRWVGDGLRLARPPVVRRERPLPEVAAELRRALGST